MPGHTHVHHGHHTYVLITRIKLASLGLATASLQCVLAWRNENQLNH